MMCRNLNFLLVPWLVLITWTTNVCCDTPANCSFDDVKGTWTFYESERIYGSDINCSDNYDNHVHKKRVSLSYPNIAVDDYGNQGVWTMVYNQGFEVKVAGRSYFAFSAFKQINNKTISYCDKTFGGWSRDVTVRNWACFKGVKVEKVEPKVYYSKDDTLNLDSIYGNDLEFVNAINEAQNSWTAQSYPEYESMTIRDVRRRAGSLKIQAKPPTAKPSSLTKLRAMILPDEFDWRNVSGVNYVSPVRNQGKCGSCYAFASMAGLESRVRIMTRNQQKPVFSTQDIVDCSELSQGCEGGFAYLIAGRYAQDKGVVLEECNEYQGVEQNICRTNTSCVRHYTSYYRYVGGYFGGCNEEEMKLALLKGGPLMVGFEVYDDILKYKSGIYHHVKKRELEGKFNPLEETNHAVLLVGYGFDHETKERFWSVKNSWGENWGENGFFRIKRGNDECSFESMAFEVVPIPA